MEEERTLYQKIVLVILAAMIVVFGIVTAFNQSRKGILFRDSFLLLEEVTDADCFTCEAEGERVAYELTRAGFTVAGDSAAPDCALVDLDSAAPLAQGLLAPAAKVIDVGTGAGFPGMPLAIACPGLSVTLMDAQQKRLNFLAAVIAELGLTNVTLLHARAEDGARNPALREQFDLAVARAVAPLSVLAEYLLPYVKVGGKALCWKGPALAEELGQGRKAAFLVGGKVEEAIPCPIPGRDWQHQILPIAKVTHTAKIYPRKAGTPSKKPLGTDRP